MGGRRLLSGLRGGGTCAKDGRQRRKLDVRRASARERIRLTPARRSMRARDMREVEFRRDRRGCARMRGIGELRGRDGQSGRTVCGMRRSSEGVWRRASSVRVREPLFGRQRRKRVSAVQCAWHLVTAAHTEAGRGVALLAAERVHRSVSVQVGAAWVDCAGVRRERLAALHAGVDWYRPAVRAGRVGVRM